MNCKQCDTLLPEGSVFCLTCGLKAGVIPTVNGSSGNLLERFKSYSTLKKALIIGSSAIVLFFVYAVLSPDGKTTTAAKAPNNPVTPAVAPAVSPIPATTPTVTPAATPKAATAQVKNGFDKVTYKDGSYYEGNFVNDKFQGKGTLVKADGTKIVGDFLANQINGKVVISYPKGDHYEGGMVNGLRDGSGKYTYAAGGYYDGMWKTGEKNGYAVFQYTNGDVYEGNYVNGLAHDTQGKISFKDGTSYVGAFTNGELTGQGTRYFSNGLYRGAFVKGIREGYGVFEWESGNSFEGYWKNGKRNGEGTLYYSNGSTDFGTWKDDVLVAKG